MSEDRPIDYLVRILTVATGNICYCLCRAHRGLDKAFAGNIFSEKTYYLRIVEGYFLNGVF